MGKVNRTALQSFYQNPGQVYDDTKTEGALNTLADQIDANDTEVEAKINNAASTKTVASGTSFPAGPNVDGQEFYRSDLKTLYVFDASTASWVTTSPTSFFAPTGLAGATSATRYAGGTVSGAPTVGTFVVGDFVIDQSGASWICVTAGTPGTWRKQAPTEMYIPLWFYNGINISSTAIAAGSGTSMVQKGNNSFGAYNSVPAKLHNLNSNWPTTQKFALEATIAATSPATAYVAIWDITANSIVAGSQTSTASGSPGIVRSGQFTLIPGHVYGVSVWTSNSAQAALLSDASLIVFG